MAHRLTIFLLIFSNQLFSQKLSTDQYISQYKDEAKRQMKKYRIPASITLAQAILESGNGNSELAKQSNNHFGIKCHTNWQGDKVFHDDDEYNECFRKYQSVLDSYEDHSKFLLRDRYLGLFDLSINDYKGWAKGLKYAGYATNPKYDKLLIKIIEDYDLNAFDKWPTENENKLVSGFSIGWKDLISQSFLYFNADKKYFINTRLSSSLSDVSLMLGGGHLINKYLGVGGEFGVLSRDREFDGIDFLPNFELNTHLFIPMKHKKINLKIGLSTTNGKQYEPRISVGILR